MFWNQCLNVTLSSGCSASSQLFLVLMMVARCFSYPLPKLSHSAAVCSSVLLVPFLSGACPQALPILSLSSFPCLRPSRQFLSLDSVDSVQLFHKYHNSTLSFPPSFSSFLQLLFLPPSPPPPPTALLSTSMPLPLSLVLWLPSSSFLLIFPKCVVEQGLCGLYSSDKCPRQCGICRRL